MTLQEVASMWWTGLDAQGTELPHVGWHDHDGLRRRTRRLEDLNALLTKHLAVDYVRTKLVQGPTGDYEVRIETQLVGQDPSVARWRPETSDVLDVFEGGQSRRAYWERRVALQDERAAIDDVSVFGVDDLRNVISMLKWWRYELLERREARILLGLSTTNVDDNIITITTKIQQARARLVSLLG